MEMAVVVTEEQTDLTVSPHPDLSLELFDPFEKLVEIEVCGRKYKVPEKNNLLRCFQYVAFEPISYGGFCWNGTCRLCEVDYRLSNARDGKCLTCCTRVAEGMVITETSPEIRFE